MSSSSSISTCTMRHFDVTSLHPGAFDPSGRTLRLQTGMPNIIGQRLAAKLRQPPWPSPCSDRICHADPAAIFFLIFRIFPWLWGSCWGGPPLPAPHRRTGRCRAPAQRHSAPAPWTLTLPRGPNPPDIRSWKPRVREAECSNAGALACEEQAEVSRGKDTTPRRESQPCRLRRQGLGGGSSESKAPSLGRRRSSPAGVAPRTRADRTSHESPAGLPPGAKGHSRAS